MSLKRINNLTENVLNIIMYVQSPTLQYFIKSKLKDQFKVHRDFIVDVEKPKALEDAKLDSMVAPLMCDKWLIHVDADKLKMKDIKQSIVKNTNHGITVYWTESYRIFKQITDLPFVKKQSVYNPTFSYSRLTEGDIKYLHDEMISKDKRMKPELLDFVMKNYRYDVQAVCDLFTLVRSGNEVENKREIIENVGVGGNSIASLTMKILSAKPQTARGLKTSVGKIIRLLDDLSVSYDYRSIKRFMLNNIEGFIEMKQLQIMGLYNRPNKEIPESFNTKRLMYLRRFERTILEDVSLPQLLNLKVCLVKYESYNTEIALVQAIMDYYYNNIVSRKGVKT